MSKHASSLDAAALAAEEKERKLAEERALAALKLQRKQRLQAMSIKRQRNFAYLKKIHQGGCYWLNTVLLTPFDVRTLIGGSVSKQRVESLFTLGISVSKIVGLNAGLPIVRAFSQLMEEWEYVHAGPTMQGVKFVMAKTSPCIYPQVSPIEGFTDLSRPSVYKFNNSVVFEHLQLPHIPFELDYAEVFLGLCTQLSRLYEKLVHEECYGNQVIYDAIVRLDTRVKHHIINMVAKEVTEACSRKMKAGTRALRAQAGVQLQSASAATGGSGSGSGSGGSSSPVVPRSGSSASLTGRSGSPATTATAAAVASGGKAGIAAMGSSSPSPAVPRSSEEKEGDGRKSELALTAEAEGNVGTAAVSVDNPVLALKKKSKSQEQDNDAQPEL